MTLLVVSTQFRLQIYIVNLALSIFLSLVEKIHLIHFPKSKVKILITCCGFKARQESYCAVHDRLPKLVSLGFVRVLIIYWCVVSRLFPTIYKVLDICDIEGNHVDISLSNTIHLVHFHLTHDSLSATYHINIQCNNRTLF